MGTGHQEMPQGIIWAPNMLPSASVMLKLGMMKISDSCQHGDAFKLLIFCQKESRMVGQQRLMFNVTFTVSPGGNISSLVPWSL